jgi:hypothetical protein
MAKKVQQPPAEAATEFELDLTSALHKIGEDELRALAFGYLHGREQGIVSETASAKSGAFHDIFEAWDERPPTFAALEVETSALADPTFFEGDAQAAAESPYRYIIRCIADAFYSRQKPFSKSKKPSQVFPNPYIWADVAQQIYKCVSKKYPKFEDLGTPSKSRQFYDFSLEVFAQAIYKAVA